MGTEINSAAATTTTEPGNGGNPRTASTSTQGAGAGARAGATAAAGTPAQKEQSKSLLGLSDVEKENALQEKDKAGTITTEEKLELRRLRKNRLKREKYQQEKEDREKMGITQGEPIKIMMDSPEPEPLENIPKPKKAKATRTKAKAQKPVFEADQLDAIIVAVFDLIASRPNMGVWKITKQEAHSISVPLCEVLAKYDQLNTFTQNSAEIALIVACISIMVPRVIATAKINKELRQDGLSGKSSPGSTGRKLDETRPSTVSSEKPNKQATAASANDAYLNDAFGLPL